jgi:hypothetical protein
MKMTVPSPEQNRPNPIEIGRKAPPGLIHRHVIDSERARAAVGS